jgi:hypothetical protein
MNRNQIFFIAGFALIFVAFMPPVIRREFGCQVQFGICSMTTITEPMWEVGFILVCCLVGLSLTTIAALRGDGLLPFIGIEEKVGK